MKRHGMGSRAEMQCDVLIPTVDRPGALAVTLAGLAAQNRPLRIVIADQSRTPAADHPEIVAMERILANQGCEVEIHRRPARRGIAEQRQFLLQQARAEAILYLDDDIWLQPWAVERMLTALDELRAGLVGMAPVGLSYLNDQRPDQWTAFQQWEDHVEPEVVRRGADAWQRHALHNAANPAHLSSHSGASRQHPVAYRIAWIGGCVMYRRRALVDVGGFEFWADLPTTHAGEDVVAQLRVLETFGGAGLLPSGAVHLELPTTLADRRHEAYDVLDVGAADSRQRA